MARVDERVSEIRKEVASVKGGLDALTALFQKLVSQTDTAVEETKRQAAAKKEGMPTAKTPPVSLGPPVAPGKASPPRPFTT